MAPAAEVAVSISAQPKPSREFTLKWSLRVWRAVSWR